LPIPYNLFQEFEGFYSFTTDFGLSYSLFLIDTTEQFGLDEGHNCVLYHFGLTLESAVNKDDSRVYDERIEATVVSFVSAILTNNKNCIVYAASPEGNKERARIRLFERWHRRGKKQFEQIEKFDRGTSTHKQAVLLIHQNNEYKDKIIAVFLA
jgi:hypothetical protein